MMEVLEKYDEAVFYSLNKERFQDFLALREEFEANNFSRLQPLISALLTEIENINQNSTAKKEFYDYYSQFSSIKYLKKSQNPKLKLRKNYLHILERQLSTNQPVKYQDFLDFYLHWHCSDFFSEHWFLLNNKYIYFSKDFIDILTASLPYMHQVLIDLELPSVFLPLDKAMYGNDNNDNLDSGDFHQIPLEKAAEMLEQYPGIQFPEYLKMQQEVFQKILNLAASDKSYLLIKFIDLD
ncbi:MAG: hypothetical protein RML72_09060 [Bacteroidia bacterium]|nr:hypothetical protein [Bacteroidia bacterium]MDW8159005.1 hypothetical protein [Bacteroidia bacterium]